MGLVITYVIDPSSQGVRVKRILDIRTSRRFKGQSYRMPKGLIEEMEKAKDIDRYYIRQLGVTKAGKKPRVYIQPPAETYTLDFGYGPMTHQIEVTQYARKKTLKGMPQIGIDDFLAIADTSLGPLSEEEIAMRMSESSFYKALTNTFESAFGPGVIKNMTSP